MRGKDSKCKLFPHLLGRERIFWLSQKEDYRVDFYFDYYVILIKLFRDYIYEIKFL